MRIFAKADTQGYPLSAPQRRRRRGEVACLLVLDPFGESGGEDRRDAGRDLGGCLGGVVVFALKSMAGASFVASMESSI